MLNLALEYAEAVRPSQLSFHDDKCCAMARAWFLNMDRWPYAGNPALPAWIRERYEWGPSSWPLYWCEAIKREKLDCGALSALALAAFAERGVQAYPCQIIRKYDRRTIEQWRAAWGREGCLADWAVGEYAYHEVCAIVRGRRLEVWDPSCNERVSANDNPGYGSAVALRVRGAEDRSESFMWGSQVVPLNRWVLIGTQAMSATAHRATDNGNGSRRSQEVLKKLAS